tara:strand:+ start:185 stop:415 length:231 start_codon:yes stop_codon:yes gene_type:complete
MVNIYDVSIRCEHQIDVEDFIKFQDEIYNKTYIQETLCEMIADRYAIDIEIPNVNSVHVEMKGIHSGTIIISKKSK